MLVALPLVGFVLFFLIFHFQGNRWRDATIHAATAWGVGVVVLTELLSFPYWLTKTGLATAWAIIDCTLFVYLSQKGREKIHPADSGSDSPTFSLRQSSNEILLGLLSAVALVLVLIGVTAWCSAPNTWDAMTYHLPRVVHWLQNKTVAFYPTQDLRQLYLQPGAEFFMLHLQALYGADNFAAAVQWFSLVASVIGVTLLAQALGASPRGQSLTAVACATIPQGLLQASAVKNDYVATFWLVAFVYYFLRFRQNPQSTSWFGVGCTLGLAWLTKGTAYVFSLGLLAVWGIVWLWPVKTIVLKRLPLILLLVVGINAGFFLRNYQMVGSSLGPMSYGPFKLTNDDLSLTTTASNLLRNLALHVGTPVAGLNARMERQVEAVIRAFGGDPNDTRSTWHSTTFHIPLFSTREELAGNPFHLLLILFTLLWAARASTRRALPEVGVYIGGMAVAFLLFCTFLRWQPWHTRLHIALFVLWSPIIGLMLERTCSRANANRIGFLLVFLAGPHVLRNDLRPLITYHGQKSVVGRERTEMYFAARPHLLQSYTAAAHFVHKHACQAIGISLPQNGYEYPLLVLLQGNDEKKRISAVGVQNPSSLVEATHTADFMPCVVVCVECKQVQGKWHEGFSSVGPASVFGDVIVFGPALGREGEKTEPSVTARES